MGHGATPWRGAGPAAKARARERATLRPDLEKHVGHDLNPLEDGSVRRHRSSVLTIGAGMRLGAAASVGCPEQEPRLRPVAVKTTWFRKSWFRKTSARTGGSVASRPPSRLPDASGGE